MATPFGFAGGHGYQAGPDSGLMLLGARYYDASTGRFISRDPIGYDGGLNLYRYAENSPTWGVDPSGTTVLVTALFGALVGGVGNALITAAMGGSWREIGQAGATGAIGGAITGLTLGLGGAAIAGSVGGGVAGGALSGVAGGVAGNAASQGFGMAMGWQDEFSGLSLAAAGTLGAAGGAFSLRPSTDAFGAETVTSWANKNQMPDLKPDRWVMLGEANYRNYLMSIGPWGRGYPYSNSVTGSIPGAQLSYPSGWSGNLAGLFGQRQIGPPIINVQ